RSTFPGARTGPDRRRTQRRRKARTQPPRQGTHTTGSPARTAPSVGAAVRPRIAPGPALLRVRCAFAPGLLPAHKTRDCHVTTDLAATVVVRAHPLVRAQVPLL